MKHRIRPEIDLAHILPRVQMPGRYTGGEFGLYPPTEEDELVVAVCFPDLYEIGMSNLAVKLLYRELNELPGIRSERVFAPAPDFEELLKGEGIPLYTLESGMPLHEVDVLAISVGYELAFTSIFTVLESGGIPFRASERQEGMPLVIAGGPAISNPAPFRPFFDGIYFGEAEQVFTELTLALREVKRQRSGRSAALELLRSSEHVLSHAEEGGSAAAGRAVWDGFDMQRPGRYPVPNIDVVQDHGVVEIMRGCPNGCRFCHAGFYYRPYRQKSFATIEAEVEYLVDDLGYREITLSSLSSGDFKGLDRLVRRLHRRWGGRGVSFALPSLKVDSFTLPLLQEISRVRKSGLTFAVETPEIEWQRGLNKDVAAEKIIAILQEARERGWNMAKFYFMIGLPPHLYGGREAEESEAIAAFLSHIREETGFKLNANVGTFIPKPHTPYQWSRQLDEATALARIKELRDRFRKSPVKIAYHSPFISFLEGVIARGDEKAGELALTAYRNGARLDAWEEHLNVPLWREVIARADWEVEHETCRERDVREELPWDTVDSGVEKPFLLDELRESEQGELTGACTFPCEHNCGVCRDGRMPLVGGEAASGDSPDSGAEEPVARASELPEETEEPHAPEEEQEGRWYVFSFQKTGKASYLSHINIMNIFTRALQRAGLSAEFTRGFNPKPRIEFAQPLALGISSEAEIGRVKLIGIDPEEPDEEGMIERINAKMPSGIRLTVLRECAGRAREGRGVSLMPYFGGASFRITPLGVHRDTAVESRSSLLQAARAYGLDESQVYSGGEEGELVFEVPATGEKAYKLKEFVRSYTEFPDFLSRFHVHRTALWTRSEEVTVKDPMSYIELFTRAADGNA